MRRNRWWTLAVLAVAQFMVVLDVTIVNVALPHIQTDLRFSANGLQWVVSAYTLTFGGFLLLGGRAPRGPGLGGAMLSPAALSLLTVTFPHGRDRNIALGVWGALAGLGGTLGVVAGGILVDGIGWEWVFFVNVPIGAALVAVAPALVSESRLPRSGSRDLDAVGALLGTAGLLAIVFGVVRAEPLGWGAPEVVTCLAAGAALLSAFALVERRATSPLVPLRLFRARGLRTASGAELVAQATAAA